MTIRHREDGVIELAPELAPLDRSQRQLFIVTLLLVATGLFVSGAMPAPVLGAIFAICLAGETFLALKALALVLFRPLAQVHEVSRWRPRRR